MIFFCKSNHFSKLSDFHFCILDILTFFFFIFRFIFYGFMFNILLFRSITLFSLMFYHPENHSKKSRHYRLFYAQIDYYFTSKNIFVPIIII